MKEIYHLEGIGADAQWALNIFGNKEIYR